LTFEYAGKEAFDQSIMLDLPALSGIAHFGGDYWFGGDVYFGAAFENRLVRQQFFPPGQASDLQLRIQVDGVTDFRINEIGLRFKVAGQ
jgi:hypothetical protein